MKSVKSRLFTETSAVYGNLQVNDPCYRNLWNKLKSKFNYGEELRHAIAHEIHHMGRLSVWAREIGKDSVTANLIRSGLFE